MNIVALLSTLSPRRLASAPPYHSSQGLVGIQHCGVSGECSAAPSLHCVYVSDIVRWTTTDAGVQSPPAESAIGLVRPPSAAPIRAWSYLVTHFGFGRRDMNPSRLARLLTSTHSHLFRHDDLDSLEVLDLLASFLQHTAYVDRVFVHGTHDVAPILTASTEWYGILQSTSLSCWCIGEGVTHAVMESVGRPPAPCEVWVWCVADADDLLRLLMASWPSINLAATDATYHITRTGAATEATYHITRTGAPPLKLCIISPADRWTRLTKLQPDFRQCAWQLPERQIVCSPRCRRAQLTGISRHSPVSQCCEHAVRAGFKVEGGSERTPALPSRPSTPLHIPNQVDLDHSPSWYPGANAFFRTSRLFVRDVCGTVVQVRAPCTLALESVYIPLLSHLSNVEFTPSIFEISVAAAVIKHAMTDDELDVVPRGCSISGVVWYSGDLHECDGLRKPLFWMHEVEVHPSHLYFWN